MTLLEVAGAVERGEGVRGRGGSEREREGGSERGREEREGREGRSLVAVYVAWDDTVG